MRSVSVPGVSRRSPIPTHLLAASPAPCHRLLSERSPLQSAEGAREPRRGLGWSSPSSRIMGNEVLACQGAPYLSRALAVSNA